MTQQEIANVMYDMGYMAGWEHGWRKSKGMMEGTGESRTHDFSVTAIMRVTKSQQQIADTYGETDNYKRGVLDGISDGEEHHLRWWKENAA